MVKKIGGSKVTYSFRKSSKYGMVSAAIGVLAIIGAPHVMASEIKAEKNVVVNEKVEVRSNVEVPVEKNSGTNLETVSIEKKTSAKQDAIPVEKKASANVESSSVEKEASKNAGITTIEKKESANTVVAPKDEKAGEENDNKLVAKSEVGFDSDNNGGLDYELTAGAGNLSGGQKQRLLAAKAILKNSYIYILDEAVSNIDDYSKNIVLSAFDSIKEGKIIIIISHDLETITNSDNIYVLKDKKIIEEGTHDELLDSPSLYKRLFNDQQELKSKFSAKEVE